MLGYAKPKHPVISLIHTKDINIPEEWYGKKFDFDKVIPSAVLGGQIDVKFSGINIPMRVHTFGQVINDQATGIAKV